MKLHRFYVNPDNFELDHDFWVHDKEMVRQWQKVLRFQPGQELVLFDGVDEDRLYKLTAISDLEAHLEMVTELERKVPKKHIYLAWSLLKKDKNEWVVQKCTELGASHFIPLITERSTRTDISQFRLERLQKIAIEAVEQCGRSDIPTVREPIRVTTLFEEFKGKLPIYICEQGEQDQVEESDSLVVLVGPEGGWSDIEKDMFASNGVLHLGLHDFTLRAETASVSAVAKLIQ